MDVILSEIGMHTQDQATLLEMAEGCGYWPSAIEGRERFVHCESQSIVLQPCGGFMSPTLCNWKPAQFKLISLISGSSQ